MAKSGKEKGKVPVEMLYGAHAIIEMLKAKRRKLLSIYTTKNLPRAWNRIQAYLPASIPNIQYVNKDVLDRMAGTTDHNCLIALVSPFKFTQNVFNAKEKPFIVLLDSIQDVRNVGAILRSAYCTGVDGIVMCKAKGAPLSPAVFKASAGLAEHMPIYQVGSLKQAIAELTQSGYHFYMAVLDGKDATQTPIERPCCLVIGNEAEGITKDIRSHGTLITLPQRTPDISYNASVAAGILMFIMKYVPGKK